MDFHRRWAAHRAWRVRAMLAALLALAAWPGRALLGPAALFLPLAALFYPLRREEKRALAEIDEELGLVYRTALETPAGDPAAPRLRREAEEAARRARLPRFPWAELTLAAALWLAAGFLPPPGGKAPTTSAASPGSTGAAQRPAGGKESQSADQEGGREQATPPRSGPAAPGQEEASPAANEEAPRQGDARSAEKGAREPAATRTQPAPAAPFSCRVAASGEPASASEGSGEGQPAGTVGGEGASVPKAAAPGEKAGEAGAQLLDSTGGAGRGRKSGGNQPPKAFAQPAAAGGEKLPSPWPAGSPPQDVKRAAERYIQNNPLPPGAAEALRRYFELER